MPAGARSTAPAAPGTAPSASRSAPLVRVLGPRWRSVAALALVVLLAGAVFTAWFGWSSDASMRADMLAEVRLVASGFDAGQIERLSASDADLASPDYQALKDRLTSARAADGRYRVWVLLGRMPDGTLFFYADSELPSSDDYLPPGQLYPEASARTIQVFDTGRAYVEGPTSDQWGTWVSGVVPIPDPATGKVVAILGAVIQAGSWNANLAEGMAAPAGITLLLSGGIPLVVARRRRIQRIQDAHRDALRERDERYHQFFASSLDGVFITSGTGQWIDFNDVAIKIFGCDSRQDLQETPITRRYHDPAERAGLLRKMAEDGFVQEYPARMDRKDGTIIDTLITTVRNRMKDGSVDSYVGSIRDITERKRADKRIRLQHELLVHTQQKLLSQRDVLKTRQAEILQLNREIGETARIDPLTGLGNRLRLNEDLAALEGRISRFGGNAGLVLLDLDHFKEYNDRYGHPAGDIALRAISDTLRATLRVSDSAYRYGGEEILVTLPEADLAGTEAMARRILAAIERRAIEHADNLPWRVMTASAGIALLERAVSPSLAIGVADVALYEAKRRGRNQVVSSAPHLPGADDASAPRDGGSAARDGRSAAVAVMARRG